MKFRLSPGLGQFNFDDSSHNLDNGLEEKSFLDQHGILKFLMFISEEEYWDNSTFIMSQKRALGPLF
jgi:hypothetical protein